MDEIERGGPDSLPATPTVAWISLCLGVILIASTTMWPHSFLQAANGLIVGGLVVLASGAWLFRRGARAIVAALGFWLASSSFFIPRPDGRTLAADILIAVLLIALAVFPSSRRRATAA